MILVHHLRVGRSVFTVWLLEELGLNYDLRIYVRDENGRAQDDLKQAHFLGKSPVIEDGPLKLAESGAITSYLVATYDRDGNLTAPAGDKAAQAIWTQWLHYPEGSAFAPLLIKLLLSREQDPKPPLISGFAAGEVALHLTYIQNTLGDQPFILGERFQAPDIGVSYILQLAKRLGELGDYPRLNDYLERTLSRPGFTRAMERTGG